MQKQFMFILFISSLILASCGKDDWSGKTRTENGVQIIENPEQGVWKSPEIELIEDLSVGAENESKEMFANIKAVRITADGRIYILDSGNFRVAAFNNMGQFLFQFGTKGQGPGEFTQAWDMDLDADNNVYVLDVNMKRIDKFSQDGQYLDNIQSVQDESFDLKANTVLFTDIKYTHYGAFAKVLDLELSQVKFELELLHTYDPNVTVGGFSLGEKYQYLRDGNIYLSVPYPYEIRKYSALGKLETQIFKTDSRVVAPYIKIKGDMRFMMGKGKSGPCFLTDQYLINNCQWYIQKEKEGAREARTALDFFNHQGHFLGSIALPNEQSLVAVDQQDNLYLLQPEPYEKVIRVRLQNKKNVGNKKQGLTKK